MRVFNFVFLNSFYVLQKVVNSFRAFFNYYWMCKGAFCKFDLGFINNYYAMDKTLIAETPD